MSSTHLRQHKTVEFSFDVSKKAAVTNWLKEVQLFFHPVNLHNYADSRRSGAAAGFPSNATKGNSGMGVGGAGSNGPYQFSLNYDLSQLGSILEGAAVNYLVQLISNLGHFSEGVRLQAVYHIYQLANILSDKAIRKEDFERILSEVSISGTPIGIIHY